MILDEYADWEGASLAAVLNQQKDYCVKTVSASTAPVVSIGGFSTNPDYDVAQALETPFAGLVLIGGKSWRKPQAKQIQPLVERALEKNVVVAGICDATVFLGSIGILNHVEHTSNQLEALQAYAGDNYTGSAQYRLQQAVRCGNIVTANGTAFMEFAREVLLALEAMAPEEVDQWYRFFKFGYYEATQNGAE